ncbi:hypothetical protein [Caldinitratiruptor microaerophilus]|uniref:Uncharacterized protein n=1 Tax=Caldinitratiruptor microaerophilus TaxID=671077 RepID=A0AA35CM98_9FIRM|nr:hypothetical protein [Caldinitratiruptor microaerophilus]BDG61934.1 hypothetical protein caldi_30240 [Caldinitratiruptor microaerophilus]
MNAFTLAPQGEVEAIEVAIVVEDATGTAYFTDLMLQPGGIATLWQGHPSEIPWSSEA